MALAAGRATRQPLLLLSSLQAAGRQAELLPIQRIFLYMPLMHSEALEDQNVGGGWLGGGVAGPHS